MNEDVGPGQQLSARIVDIHLDLQRAGGEVDRVGVSHERALERPPRELIEGEGCGASGTGGSRVDLGDGHEHAERVDGRHVEELPARGIRSGFIRAPMSTVRGVVIPSDGSPIFPNAWSCSSRRAVATFQFQVAFIALSALTAWSVSCLETESVSRSACQRSAVIWACRRLACAVSRSARACSSCWSTSGLSISARSCPCFTCAPMSKYQAFT